jgi:hypothetical protein
LPQYAQSTDFETYKRQSSFTAWSQTPFTKVPRHAFANAQKQLEHWHVLHGFWSWRSLFSRALEFSQHTRVSNFSNIEILDSRTSHFPAP